MSAAAPTLPEEILLLTLDDRTGRPVGRSGMAPDLALAGAVLMELALAGRLDTDRDRLLPVSDAPTGDAVLDAALARLAEGPADARGAILLLARAATAMREALLERLVAAGRLRREEGRVLLLFRDRRFPKPDGAAAQEARARLRATLLAEEIPEPRDALLLGLARAAGLLPLILPAEELEQVQPWLSLVSRIESLNRSLSAAVADVLASRGAG